MLDFISYAIKIYIFNNLITHSMDFNRSGVTMEYIINIAKELRQAIEKLQTIVKESAPIDDCEITITPSQIAVAFANHKDDAQARLILDVALELYEMLKKLYESNRDFINYSI